MVAYAATPLSSVPPGASLETPHAPGGLVGTKAQAHNIELVLYQPYGKRVHLWNTYKLPQKRYPAG